MSSAIGHHEYRATPRLVPIVSPRRLLFSTPNKPIALFAAEESDNPSTNLSQIPLISHTGEVVGSSAYDSAAIGIDATEWDQGTPAALKTLSPVDLDDKISAILAATALFKSLPHSTTPQLSTDVSRALSNMGRQPVEALQVSKKTKVQKMAKEATPELQKRSLSPSKASVESPTEQLALMPDQLNTIELRLNEGNNLNRRKVQKIVGGSIRRKPVNCQIQPVRQSIVDNYHGSNGRIDSRLDGPKDYVCTYPRDPFGEETSFEENLSDGLLSECPTGSSTPRTIASTTRLHRIDEDDDDLSVYLKPEHETLPAEDLVSSLQTAASYAGVAAIAPAHGHRRVKKHPSPSKKALEDLEVAFAVYARLKPLEGGDETDELAKDGLAALAVSDHNKVMRRETKTSIAKPAHSIGRGGAYRIRRSLPLRASLTKSHDFDELGN
ncbi:hypothetical protein LMH87_010445 [Akanthomyces muscarius]|uniref:Uncharacterized protein n=1 Tax=Akanthomyces muscarius TaxID=2231603 RepID=A0A9W8QG27_AKAMU|nr:hypothetical protein LMH87_010445 [Akanthomyces muscarius]KAJ4153981.1 hypothetical protein LMH87_010445 [Akanthomyces muscarius]